MRFGTGILKKRTCYSYVLSVDQSEQIVLCFQYKTKTLSSAFDTKLRLGNFFEIVSVSLGIFLHESMWVCFMKLLYLPFTCSY